MEKVIKLVKEELNNTLDSMEMDKVPAEGYKITGLWISGIQRNFSFRRKILKGLKS